MSHKIEGTDKKEKIESAEKLKQPESQEKEKIGDRIKNFFKETGEAIRGKKDGVKNKEAEAQNGKKEGVSPAKETKEKSGETPEKKKEQTFTEYLRDMSNFSPVRGGGEVSKIKPHGPRGERLRGDDGARVRERTKDGFER